MLRVLFLLIRLMQKTFITPSISVFRYLFRIVDSANDTGWVNIQHRTLTRHILITGTMSDSLHNWKGEFFTFLWRVVVGPITLAKFFQGL